MPPDAALEACGQNFHLLSIDLFTHKALDKFAHSLADWAGRPAAVQAGHGTAQGPRLSLALRNEARLGARRKEAELLVAWNSKALRASCLSRLLAGFAADRCLSWPTSGWQNSSIDKLQRKPSLGLLSGVSCWACTHAMIPATVRKSASVCLCFLCQAASASRAKQLAGSVGQAGNFQASHLKYGTAGLAGVSAQVFSQTVVTTTKVQTKLTSGRDTIARGDQKFHGDQANVLAQTNPAVCFTLAAPNLKVHNRRDQSHCSSILRLQLPICLS